MDRKITKAKNTQFIESFYDAKSPMGSIEDRIKEIQEWITDNNREHSPVMILGEKGYTNFLYYLLIYMIDLQLGKKKSFDPDQDYRQEVKRVYYTIFLSDFRSKGDSSLFSDNDELNIDGIEINSLQNSSEQDFIDGDVNYFFYLDLRKIDLKLDNCRPYRPMQDYIHEIIRHEMTVELGESIGDISSEQFYLVNCAYAEIIYNNFEASGFLD